MFGQCDGQTTQIDSCADFMVIKSFGTSRYIDKNGKLQEKSGPQYNHFNEDCIPQTGCIMNLLNLFHSM